MLKTIFLVFIATFAFSQELQKPKIYSNEQNLIGWIMSEKLDGIRGYWNGREFLSRSLKKLNAPKDFTENFPPFELDGEFWTKRADFENIQNIIMDKKEPNWDAITYNIFEVPNAKGDFFARLQKAKDWFETHPNKNVKFIAQINFENSSQMQNYFDDIIENGGEGIILKNPNANYEGGRSDKVLKLKKFEDAEGVVIDIKISPKTKVLQSVKLKLANDIVFDLGGGFSDQERKNPPKIGEVITFKYSGFTKQGKPKFASFLHIRKD